ncbi:MAG: hypothetical protein PHC50_05315 [Candidatus Cloacimonetes bacterium]|nr:hypothetical protein [Candidatus Cloacimonadota bacterium]
MVEVFTIIGGIGEVQIAGNEQVTKGFQIIAKLQASCREGRKGILPQEGGCGILPQKGGCGILPQNN